MKPGLKPGVRIERDFEVTEAMCPHFDGVLAHPVVATWTLVHEMEVTGRKLLAPHLEENEEALGTHVSIDHLAPAGIGARVTVRAEVERCSDRKLVCTMLVRCGERLLARGRFDQTFVRRDRLRRALETLQSGTGG